ncbi:MAG TPA: hypothetical protein VE871_17245 [Longimicrobium sp.]|nr:hypothetical protein [Longimicrobium sp.]
MMLAIVALAGTLAAEGVQTFAEMRERHFSILARQAAVSPVSYGTILAAVHSLRPTRQGVRVMVRSDLAGPDAAALCVLAEQTAVLADVQWMALSADVDPCVARRVGERMLRAGTAAAQEFGRARWLVLDATGRTLYSRADVPSPAHVRQIWSLLAPGNPAEPI